MARFGAVLSFVRCKNSQPACQALLSLYSRLLLVVLLPVMFLARATSQTLPNITAGDQLGELPYVSYHGGDIDAVSLRFCPTRNEVICLFRSALSTTI
jgi:hypothetical protein